jgi:hypothetical protein
MLSFHRLVATGVAALLVIASAFGQAPTRVRGTITALNDGSITVKERDGRIRINSLCMNPVENPFSPAG